ncbi:MAG: Gfo/Idh/MocA family oxidoreductase [Acidimicrobiia bacterium]
MRPVRFGLVGAGRIAQAYAQALQSTELVEMVGVVDVRGEAGSALAGQLGCPALTSHEALVDSVEAVLVCTPPASHPSIAVDFLGSGVHVMSEKPLANSIDEAVKMVDAANTSGALLTMASKFRYVDDVVRAKSIMASGILGEIILFENSFASRVDMASRWNAQPSVSGGGVLIDNGTHSVDIARLFLGPITAVMAAEGKRVQTVDVEDTVQLFLRSSGGARATIDLSWSVDKERDNYIDIYGSEGTIRIGWKESKYRQMSSPNWVPFGSGYDKIGALRAQVENFCGAIRGTEHLRITSRDALASVEVVDAAYRSLEQDNWVPVMNGINV